MTLTVQKFKNVNNINLQACFLVIIILIFYYCNQGAKRVIKRYFLAFMDYYILNTSLSLKISEVILSNIRGHNVKSVSK
jgi:hypothetical protein